MENALMITTIIALLLPHSKFCGSPPLNDEPEKLQELFQDSDEYSRFVESLMQKQASEKAELSASTGRQGGLQNLNRERRNLIIDYFEKLYSLGNDCPLLRPYRSIFRRLKSMGKPENSKPDWLKFASEQPPTSRPGNWEIPNSEEKKDWLRFVTKPPPVPDLKNWDWEIPLGNYPLNVGSKVPGGNHWADIKKPSPERSPFKIIGMTESDIFYTNPTKSTPIVVKKLHTRCSTETYDEYYDDDEPLTKKKLTSCKGFSCDKCDQKNREGETAGRRKNQFLDQKDCGMSCEIPRKTTGKPAKCDKCKQRVHPATTRKSLNYQDYEDICAGDQAQQQKIVVKISPSLNKVPVVILHDNTLASDVSLSLANEYFLENDRLVKKPKPAPQKLENCRNHGCEHQEYEDNIVSNFRQSNRYADNYNPQLLAPAPIYTPYRPYSYFGAGLPLNLAPVQILPIQHFGQSQMFYQQPYYTVRSPGGIMPVYFGGNNLHRGGIN